MLNQCPQPVQFAVTNIRSGSVLVDFKVWGGDLLASRQALSLLKTEVQGKGLRVNGMEAGGVFEYGEPLAETKAAQAAEMAKARAEHLAELENVKIDLHELQVALDAVSKEQNQATVDREKAAKQADGVMSELAETTHELEKLRGENKEVNASLTTVKEELTRAEHKLSQLTEALEKSGKEGKQWEQEVEKMEAMLWETEQMRAQIERDKVVRSQG